MKIEIDHLYITRGGVVVLVDWQQANGCLKVSPYSEDWIYLVDEGGRAKDDGSPDNLDLIVDLGSRWDEHSSAGLFLAERVAA